VTASSGRLSRSQAAVCTGVRVCVSRCVIEKIFALKVVVVVAFRGNGRIL
jgi:hypothetical protein